MDDSGSDSGQPPIDPPRWVRELNDDPFAPRWRLISVFASVTLLGLAGLVLLFLLVLPYQQGFQAVVSYQTASCTTLYGKTTSTTCTDATWLVGGKTYQGSVHWDGVPDSQIATDQVTGRADGDTVLVHPPYTFEYILGYAGGPLLLGGIVGLNFGVRRFNRIRQHHVP